MKILFREYGSFMLAFISTILFFLVMYNTSFTAIGFGLSGKGMGEALGIEVGAGTEGSAPGYVASVGAQEGIPFKVDQELVTGTAYHWYEIVRPDGGTARLAFSVIDVRAMGGASSGGRYHMGDAGSDGAVEVTEGDDGVSIRFSRDGLYSMRFRLVNTKTGAIEQGACTVYVRKPR